MAVGNRTLCRTAAVVSPTEVATMPASARFTADRLGGTSQVVSASRLARCDRAQAARALLIAWHLRSQRLHARHEVSVPVARHEHSAFVDDAGQARVPIGPLGCAEAIRPLSVATLGIDGQKAADRFRACKRSNVYRSRTSCRSSRTRARECTPDRGPAGKRAAKPSNSLDASRCASCIARSPSAGDAALTARAPGLCSRAVFGNARSLRRS